MSKKKVNPCDLILTKELKCDTYWDIESVEKKNCMLNIIMGGRSIGKTVQALIRCCMNFRDYGEQFVYVMRYASLISSKHDLLDSVANGISFEGDGNGGGYFKFGDNRVGYLMALSKATSYKSGNYEKVTTLIYDEAIIDPSATERYIPGETTKLLGLISTIFRHRSNYRVYCLGNNLNFFNPYCAYFKVPPFRGNYKDDKRGLFIQYVKHSEKLLAIEEETPLYRLVQGTAYGDYHYNNEVLTNKKVVISKKYNNDKLMQRLILNTYTLNIYLRSTGRMLVESKSKVINDNFSLKLIVDSEINYNNVDILKMHLYKLICYKYYNEELDYCDTNSSYLVNEIIEMF